MTTHTHIYTHRERWGEQHREKERFNGITLQLDVNPHSRHHRLKYLALGIEDLFWNLWLVTLNYRCIDFETLQTILELDDKTPIAKDTAYFNLTTWGTQAGTYLETHHLLDSFHCYVHATREST